MGSYNNTQTRSLSDITSNTNIAIANTNRSDYTGTTYMDGSQIRFQYLVGCFGKH
jgi:hypothetical protein